MDKQKEIEELAKELHDLILDTPFNGTEASCNKIAEELLKHYQPKIHENAVVIPKEISVYTDIKRNLNVFKTDLGERVELTTEQILFFTKLYHFSENKVRKETAEKFRDRLKIEFDEILLSDTPLSKIDKICKEFTENEKTN